MERFDVVEQEQLAAQLIAVMQAHFQRPSPDQMRRILRLAADQIRALDDASGAQESPARL